MAHRTVRCLTEKETNQSGDSLPRLVLLLFTIRCAPDSPVRPRTKGKNCLPNGAPTTSSCLGAIKETPSRMEQYTKPLLNILRRLDSANTHSDHRDWDLSTSCVVNLLHCSCVHIIAAILAHACVSFPPLLLWPFLVNNIVRVRGSNLWRFLTNGKHLLRKKPVVLKFDH
jgi:hypothetical protein